MGFRDLFSSERRKQREDQRTTLQRTFEDSNSSSSLSQEKDFQSSSKSDDEVAATRENPKYKEKNNKNEPTSTPIKPVPLRPSQSEYVSPVSNITAAKLAAKKAQLDAKASARRCASYGGLGPSARRVASAPGGQTSSPKAKSVNFAKYSPNDLTRDGNLYLTMYQDTLDCPDCSDRKKKHKSAEEDEDKNKGSGQNDQNDSVLFQEAEEIQDEQRNNLPRGAFAINIAEAESLHPGYDDDKAGMTFSGGQSSSGDGDKSYSRVDGDGGWSGDYSYSTGDGGGGGGGGDGGHSGGDGGYSGGGGGGGSSSWD